MLPGDRKAREGLRRFEAGDSPGALELLHQAMALGVSRIESVEVYLALAAGTGQHGIEAAERFLADERLDIAPLDQAQLRAEILRASSESDPGFDTEAQRLIAMLQAVASAGPDGWEIVENPEMRSVIDRHLMPSSAGVAVAEQLLYAPAETGWPAIALESIETIGLAAIHDLELARASERLLHAAGMPEAAYRIEQIRRIQAQPEPRTRRSPSHTERLSLSGQAVAIAGGHPALRAMIASEITSLGGSIREIPSRHEAVRRDKDIMDALRGAGVAVVIIPQIAHSTSDQVKRAAGRLLIPVIIAPSASVQSIVALVTRWSEESA
jgi:hypothetical protein